jgi:hypothetical protein
LVYATPVVAFEIAEIASDLDEVSMVCLQVLLPIFIIVLLM